LKFERIVEISYSLKPIEIDYRCFHLTFALKNRKIISIGMNNCKKTHPKNRFLNHIDPVTKEHYGSNSHIHSELDCILKLRKTDCRDLTFVNIRIDNNGLLNLSKPCRGCNSLLKQVGFKRLYYSTGKGNFEEF